MEIFENQKPLSLDFNESLDRAQISPNGFREYDARWLYPEEINKKRIGNIRLQSWKIYK